MSWRLHLTNQTIPYLHILPGKTSLLGAWFGARAYFFDLENGVAMGERSFKDAPALNRSDEKWQEYIAGLTAPNQAVLPYLRIAQNDIYISDDAHMRLYHAGHADLTLEVDGRESKLDSGKAGEFLAVALDRFLGSIAAIDENGLLHLYQQHIPVGVFDIGLHLNDDIRPMLRVTNGGSSIYVTAGQDVIVVDSGGRVTKKLETHYFISKMDCSPNGRWLVTCDQETNVLRAYNGADLLATHQRHAIDLMTQAAQVQLMADLPPTMVAVSALTVGSKGAIGFAMAGVICASEISAMAALPRPQKLL